MATQKTGATGRDFVEHWSWAAERGLMNQNTAGGMKAACKEVLKIYEDWQTRDISQIDVEETVQRFQNLRKKDFQPRSLEVYKARFRRAVASYLKYLDNPSSWKPGTRERAGVSKNGGMIKQPRVGKESPVPSNGNLDTLIDYPFPLKGGQIARLWLPRDLEPTDAKRLASFISTLAIEQ